jgi:hypothetical protein
VQSNNINKSKRRNEDDKEARMRADTGLDEKIDIVGTIIGKKRPLLVVVQEILLRFIAKNATKHDLQLIVVFVALVIQSMLPLMQAPVAVYALAYCQNTVTVR